MHDIDSDRLHQLSGQACDGRLGDADFRELEQLLGVSRDARKAYREYANIHVALWQCCDGSASETSSEGKPGGSRDDKTVVAFREQPGGPGRRKLWIAGVSAAAAAVVFGIAGLMLYQSRTGPATAATSPEAETSASEPAIASDSLTEDDPVSPKDPAVASQAPEGWLAEFRVPPPPPPGPDSVALVKNLLGAKEPGGASGLEENTWLAAGHRFFLESGLVSLRFRKGALITLKGPVDFEVVGENSAAMAEGKLLARVPPSAQGFHLDTVGLEIVDLGTSFGVSARPMGKVEVHVFKGAVEVVESEGAAESSKVKRRIGTGRAIRSVNNREDGILDIPASPGEFMRLSSLVAGVLDTSGGPIRFVESPPKAPIASIESDRELTIFPEKAANFREEAFFVNFSQPGVYPGSPRGVKQELPKGARVQSYLLQFNPVGEPSETGQKARKFAGSVRFEQPVAGMIASNGMLKSTDRIFGYEQSAYRFIGGRGLDDGTPAGAVKSPDKKNWNRDSVSLSSDRHTVRVALHSAGGVDQIRVLVLDPGGE